MRWCTKDVPDNTAVLSGEQRMITKDTPLDNRFYNHPGRWMYFDNGAWLPVEDPDILKALDGTE